MAYLSRTISDALAGFALFALAGSSYAEEAKGSRTTEDQKNTKNPSIQKPDEAGKAKPPLEESDPDVLTVSKDKKERGQYLTIGAALEKVKPGQTIRVLDDAVYQENVAINSPEQHAGICLEAPRRATVEVSMDRAIGVVVRGVPGVTVRGFRLRSSAKQHAFLIGAHGRCPGLLLQDLEFEGGTTPTLYGVELEQQALEEQDPPVVVRDCIFRRVGVGIRLSGVQNDYRTPEPNHRVMLRDNRFARCFQAIVVRGDARKVQVVGNRIWQSASTAIQLDNILPGTRDILIANNTMLENNVGLRLWDDKEKKDRGRNIEVRNNLIMGSQLVDMVFTDSGGNPDEVRGAGDGQSLHEVWQIDHNWRQSRLSKDKPQEKGWIPPAPNDVGADEIKVVSRDPEKPDFLRPAKDSPLASQGAGKTDPRLPQYVGAVPPDGVEPWDWDRTWRMPRPGLLLTVSKDPKDGGKYRTITEALKATKPWATIRVLDDATYPESILLDDPSRHEGVVLEAPKLATLLLNRGDFRSVQINGVPHVQVRGFLFRESSAAPNSNFVSVMGHTPGVVLDNLDLQAKSQIYGILLSNVTVAAAERPLVVHNCGIQVGFDAIAIKGRGTLKAGEPATGGICIRSNRVLGGYRGIMVGGSLVMIQITGNLITKCQAAGLQLTDLPRGSDYILIANNTIFDCDYGIRVWNNASYDEPIQGKVELRNNLLFGCNRADIGFVIQPKASDPTVGDREALIKRWLFAQNWRDMSGSIEAVMLPLATGNFRLDKVELVSRDRLHPDFLRPKPDSPLARDSAGKTDPSLPTYVGAVPPKGVATWDWDKTWKARVPKRAKEVGPSAKQEDKKE